MSQQALASRLTLNCMNCYVEPQKLREVDVTLMDVSQLYFDISCDGQLLSCWEEIIHYFDYSIKYMYEVFQKEVPLLNN